MFLDILEFNVENKKMVQGKLFCKGGLRFKEKIAFVSTKQLLETSAKTNKNKNKKTMKTCSFFGGFQGQNQFFWQISETTFSKQFSLNNFCLFPTLNSNMSRNMCKLCHKVRNGQNLPHESLNFTNYFFKVTLPPI